MKLYVYENLMSERFVVKEIEQLKLSSGQSPKQNLEEQSSETSCENKTYEEIFREVGLSGNFLVIENDEVKQYPECAKDIPAKEQSSEKLGFKEQSSEVNFKETIIHVKRIPGKDAGTASWWLGGVMALAGAALTIFTCGLGATIGVSLMIGGASVLAGKAIADIYKSPNVPDQRDALQGKEQYGLQGGKNRVALGGKYPVILGRHIITPPLCGGYYTELSDNSGRGDMYLYGLLCVGYGQLSVKDIKLGVNPLATNGEDVRDGYIKVDGNFKGELEIRQTGTYPSLYQYKHTEEQINGEIKETDVNKMETRFTAKKSVKIKSIVTFQGLFKAKDNGDRERFSVTVVMAYRKKGGGGWSIGEQRRVESATADTLRIELRKHFSVEELAANPDGEWEVGIYRTTAPSESMKVRDKGYWSTLTCEVNERPVIESELKKLCLIAFKIKATEASNGVLDQLNCIASSVLPVYDKRGSKAADTTVARVAGEENWKKYEVSSNPASAYLHCLMGNFLPEKAGVETIDWQALEGLYLWCETNDYKCDGIISNGEPLRSILNKILATCRASFYIKSGLYSLIHDIEKPNAIALLTPKNSRGFGASKSFAKVPKGLEITYNDKRNNYVTNNEIAVLHGEKVDGGAGDIVEKLSMWGVTGYEQVIKLGRYLLAVARNRPERYSVSVSIEHFGLPVGERVLLQHDVLMVGLAGGFIKGVDVKKKTIQIDEVLHITPSTKYAVEVFKQDGSIVFLQVLRYKKFSVLKQDGEEEYMEQSSKHSLEQSSEEHSSEESEEAIADTFEIDGDITDIEVNDIYAFGVWDKVVEDCLIEGKVINQSPNLSAELTLIPYAQEVFEAPTKPVPEYNPKTTVRKDYALVVVKEKQHEGENLNNGGTVQDDGGIYFDFGGYSVAGNRLINRGSLKGMGDGVFSGVTFEGSDEASDIGKNYAVASPVSQIRLNVDTLLYKDSSINFWIGGLASKGQSPSEQSSKDMTSKEQSSNGYIFSREGINGLEKYQLYWYDGRLIITIQNMKERVEVRSRASGSKALGEGSVEALDLASKEAMVTIVNDFSNAEVKVYVNAVLKGRYETIETNAVSEDGDNLVGGDGESSIVSEGLISYQEANRDIPFYLFGNGNANSSFSGKVRLFRIFGWSLSEQDVAELYGNNRILLNTAAETRYLGEFSLPPEDANLYDVFKYAGETNSMFINNKKYAAVPNGKLSFGELSLGKQSFGWQIWEE
ncbi:MAG: phage tail protein [Endomicrobium sp.]|jgi:hypothetical protein|nr:phage tail protein [Endomicrobium sp.]